MWSSAVPSLSLDLFLPRYAIPSGRLYSGFAPPSACARVLIMLPPRSGTLNSRLNLFGESRHELNLSLVHEHRAMPALDVVMLARNAAKKQDTLFLDGPSEEERKSSGLGSRDNEPQPPPSQAQMPLRYF